MSARTSIGKLLLCAILLNAVLAPVLFGLRASNAQPTDPPPPLSVWRVTLRSPDDVTRLTTGDWDVLEARGADYLLVLGDSVVVDQLRAEGFTVTLDHTLPSTISPLTYYNGYRTVAEHYQHLNAVEATHPTLAKLVDYGDSWGKLNARPIQNDLIAICITKLRPGDCALNPNTDKPRFLLMAAIHSRELTTAEVAWRWIDHLTTEYGSDP
ncbi:MAG: M14 family zinc carboxypeptidase, partial [Anaerolineales bacterium]